MAHPAETARSFLETSQPDLALNELLPHIATYSEDVVFLQTLGETYMELSDLESAYDCLMKACELDREAEKSVEKFLYLGQMIGGKDGLDLLNIGLNKLGQQLQHQDETLLKIYKTPEEVEKYLKQKICQGIFSVVEIWMTDLCMEPQAESQCDELVGRALSIDESNPETWSILASIRISQQNIPEAQNAIVKSWKLFAHKKSLLESNQPDIDVNEVSLAYMELIQPLITLAKFSVEVGLFDQCMEISDAIIEINENCIEAYYLDGLANYLIAKHIQNGVEKQEINQVFQQLPPLNLAVGESHPSFQFIQDARASLSGGAKLLQVDDLAETADPEMGEQITHMLQEVGGIDLTAVKIDDDEGWEDEIQSD